MGRRKIGDKPYSIYGDKGSAYISCTIAGVRRRESLGLPWSENPRSRSRIETAAAARFASLVKGRVVERHERVASADTLAEMLDDWLGYLLASGSRSMPMFRIHSDHFGRFFADTRAAFDDAAPAHYFQARIRAVLRDTVNKELSSLFRFYSWAKTNGRITSKPPRPELESSEKGVRVGTQRAAPVEVTEAEARRIIALLPEWAARGGRSKDRRHVKGAYRVRDYVELAWETGLRPSTLDKLERPRHWEPGSPVLVLTSDVDKNAWGRPIPLTRRALAILKRCATESGLVFGKHRYEAHLKVAAKKVLGEHRGALFARYDFRHGRATHVVGLTKNLLGSAYLLGHKQVTTTNRYLHPAMAEATAATRAVDRLGSQSAAAEKRRARARKQRALKTMGAKDET